MAVVEEDLLLSVLLAQLIELVTVLVLAGAGLLALVHHDDQTDDVQFLLVDAGLEEEALLVESEVLLLEFVLDVDDLVADVLEGELPGLALLLLELLLLSVG